jgi:hypothetical protein
MRSTRCVPGETLHHQRPDWQPLLDLAPELIDGFMWMFAVELANGLRLEAYKHYWTRGYIHVGAERRPFYYVWGGCGRHDACYREIALATILEEVLRPWWEELNATEHEAETCRAVIDRVRRSG